MTIRTTTSWVLLFILIGYLGGCDTTVAERFGERLESFRSILPDNLLDEFDNGNYDVVAAEIDSLLVIDDEFGSRWEKIKNAEGIGLFDAAEVVNYFGIHITRQINKQ